MPHGVGCQLANPGLCCAVLKGQPYMRVGDRQATELNRTRKYPIAVSSKLRLLFPVFENREHFRVYRHQPARVDGFYVIHHLPNNAALNTELSAQPIDIRPCQAEAFTNSQAEAHTHYSDGTNRFF